MTASAYRELEKVLERSLNAFAKTKQKLNRFERSRRDRVAEILREVVRKRREQERAGDGLLCESAR